MGRQPIRAWNTGRNRYTIGLSRFVNALKTDYEGSCVTERYPGGVTIPDQPNTNCQRRLAAKRSFIAHHCVPGFPDVRNGSPAAWGPQPPRDFSFFRPLSWFLTSENSIRFPLFLIHFPQKSWPYFVRIVNFFLPSCIFPMALVN